MSVSFRVVVVDSQSFNCFFFLKQSWAGRRDSLRALAPQRDPSLVSSPTFTPIEKQQVYNVNKRNLQKKKRKTWCPKVKNPNWQSRIQRDIRPSDFSGGKCWRNVGQTLGSDGCRLVENKFVAECQSNTTTRAASPACERSKRGRSLLFSGVCRGSANVSV